MPHPPVPPFVAVLTSSPLVLVALALILRRWRGPPVASDHWDPLRDGGLLAAAAVGGAVAMAWGTAPVSLTQYPFTASDFVDYCVALDLVRAGAFAKVHFGRSIAAAALPASLTPLFGVMGALAAAALLSTGVLCGALFLAGRALHSRTAGLAAVILAAALPPLAVLPRTVNFYPEAVAGLTLTGACAIAFVRFRGGGFALLAGVAAAAALLVDGRGLFFALPAALVASIAALAAPGRWSRRLLLLALVVAPVGASWPVAARLGAHLTSLQEQAFTTGGDALRYAGANPAILVRPAAKESFRWGLDPIPNAVRGVRYLMTLGDAVRRGSSGSPEVRGAAARVEDWKPVLALSGVIALAGLRRRPGLICAGAITSVAGAAAIRQALTGMPHPRMLAPGMPVVAIVTAVAFAVLLTGALPRPDATTQPPPSWRGAVRPALALLLLAVLVAGAVPSWLGPRSRWRAGEVGDSEPRNLIADTQAGRRRAGGDDCQRALRRDAAAGFPMLPTWYGPPPGRAPSR